MNRKELQRQFEKFGFPQKSKETFKKYCNGTRVPPDQNRDRFVRVAAKVAARIRHGLLASEHEEQYYRRFLGTKAAASSTLLLDSDINIESDLTIHEKRLEFWNKHIQEIVLTCEELVVIDSFQGEKQPFWQSLSQRVSRQGPFHLVYLILRPDDHFLTMCLGLMNAPQSVTDVDLGHIDLLKKHCAKSRYKSNKRLEFLYWRGISPGPLLAWKESGRETIALGLWLNLEEATDGVPL
jgi:hypothetical protein